MTLISFAWPTSVPWNPWNRVVIATAAVAVATVTYRVAREWYYTRRLERKRRAKRDACQRAVADLEARVNWKLIQQQQPQRDKPGDSSDKSKTVIAHSGLDLLV